MFTNPALRYEYLNPGQIGEGDMGKIRKFIKRHYKHFNAKALVDAADAYKKHLEQGGQMLVTLAGAMSTAELGRSLADMIREGKVHAISCTGANLEEDIFNLVAHDDYKQLPFEDNDHRWFAEWRELSADDEEALMARHLYRVTDTCIPEDVAVLPLETALRDAWRRAKEATDKKSRRHFPHEFLYRILLDGKLKYQGKEEHSWVLAAAQKDLPIWVPGWEDSTLGNAFASDVYKEEEEKEKELVHVVKTQEKELVQVVKTGIEYMVELIKWYEEASAYHPLAQSHV